MPFNSVQVGATISGDYSGPTDLATAVASLRVSRGAAFDSGTGAGQVDKVFADTRTLAPSTTEDLDLAGTLTDLLGAAVTFARVKGIIVAAATANVNNVIVGGVASGWASLLSPAATGLITLRPGAFFAAGCGAADATGYAVTATTADLLHVANSGAGTSVTYDVVIIGCSV